MTQLGESVTGPAAPQTDKEYSCDWSSCKGKHMVDINPKYPKDGSVTKGGYRNAWMSAGNKCPWEYDGGFKRDKLWKNGKLHYNQKDYKVQAHHLVPSTVLKGTGTLEANIKLIGYDVDCIQNGMIVPEYAIDQPLNELPQHLGNHPAGYYDPIKKVVAQIKTDYDGICEQDTTGDTGPQQGLITELNTLAAEAEQNILRIRNPRVKKFWPLRANARVEYNGAMAEYRKREARRQALEKDK